MSERTCSWKWYKDNDEFIALHVLFRKGCLLSSNKHAYSYTCLTYCTKPSLKKCNWNLITCETCAFAAHCEVSKIQEVHKWIISLVLTLYVFPQTNQSQNDLNWCRYTSKSTCFCQPWKLKTGWSAMSRSTHLSNFSIFNNNNKKGWQMDDMYLLAFVLSCFIWALQPVSFPLCYLTLEWLCTLTQTVTDMSYLWLCDIQQTYNIVLCVHTNKRKMEWDTLSHLCFTTKLNNDIVIMNL